MMLNNKTFILFLILPVLVISISGCTSSQEEGVTQPEQEEQDSGIQSGKTLQPLGAPLPTTDVKLELSKAPKVGETAELTMTVTTRPDPRIGLGHGRAWLAFSRVDTSGSYRNYKESIRGVNISPEAVLTRGNVNWEGRATTDAPLVFQTTVRFPEAGIWEVTGYFQRDGRSHPTFGSIKLAVESDRAGIYGSEAYLTGELEWMKDYSRGRAVPKNVPITASLDLTSPPRLGEHAELTWSIVSAKDIENAGVNIEFKLMEQGTPLANKIKGNETLVAGDLSWQGSLEEGVPVSSSATIKFPQEGDWEIVLICDDSESIYEASIIFLNVNKESGRWGWAEPHEIDRSKIPPPIPLEKIEERS